MALYATQSLTGYIAETCTFSGIQVKVPWEWHATAQLHDSIPSWWLLVQARRWLELPCWILSEWRKIGRCHLHSYSSGTCHNFPNRLKPRRWINFRWSQVLKCSRFRKNEHIQEYGRRSRVSSLYRITRSRPGISASPSRAGQLKLVPPKVGCGTHALWLIGCPHHTYCVPSPVLEWYSGTETCFRIRVQNSATFGYRLVDRVSTLFRSKERSGGRQIQGFIVPNSGKLLKKKGRTRMTPEDEKFKLTRYRVTKRIMSGLRSQSNNEAFIEILRASHITRLTVKLSEIIAFPARWRSVTYALALILA